MNNRFDGVVSGRGADVRCAIYIRKSTTAGLEQEFNSLDAQREACRQYIKGQARLGWRAVVPPYEDGGFTGANLERPAFQRLLADVEAGRIDVVVTHKVDRLSRSLLDFANIIDYFNRRQVAFVSVTQKFSTADSMGRLTLHMLMSFAEFEREMVSERTREKMGAARKKGKWTGGYAPFGYRVANKKLTVDEAEGKVVRRVFALYLERQSALAVLQSLNGQAHRSGEARPDNDDRPRKWDKPAVLRLLKNPLYAGYMSYRNELYEGEHEPIIDRERFHAVQRLLGEHAGTRRTSTDSYLLQGLTRCAACGAAYTPASGKQGKDKRRYYRCLTRDKQGRDACPARPLPAESLEGYVVDRVREAAARMADPADLLLAIRHDYAARLQVKLSERQRLPKLIGALSAEGTKVVKQIEQARDADRKSLDDRLGLLYEELGRMDHRLCEVEREIDGLKKQGEEAEWMIDIMARFDSVWEALTPENKRRLLRAVVKEIIIDEPSGKVEMKMVDYTAVGSSPCSPGDAAEDAQITSEPPLQTITAFVYRARQGREIKLSAAPPVPPEPPAMKPIPLAVLLAQAHQMQKTIEEGGCGNRADLSRRLGISRARLTQILNLLLLAPKIQEEILYMEAVGNRAAITEHQLRPIIQADDWSQQLRLWQALKSTNES